VNTRSRLSPATLDAAADTLLTDYPDAWVVAIVPTGHFTAMPAEVPVSSQRVIEGPFSALDLVVPEDRHVVIDAWQRTLTEGGDNIQVHPLNDPSRHIALHFVDMTHRYGVILGFFIGFGETETIEAADHADLVPKTSTIRKDQLATIIDVDDAITAILGWRRDELIGRRNLDIIHPDDQERAIANWMDMVGRPGAERRVRLRHQHKDGSWRWLEVTNINRLDFADPHVLSDLVDVTDEVTALEALRANEQLLRRLTEALPVGVLTFGTDRAIAYCNETMNAIVGLPKVSTVDGQLSTVDESDRVAVQGAVGDALVRGRDADLEVSFHPPDRSVRRCVMSLRALTSGEGAVTGAIICLSDITDEVNLREELQRQVRYDPLTACLNHASILAALEDRLRHPVPDQWTVVFFIDLDDFKGVNDRHGHIAGDRLLKGVAARLGRVAGDADLVGRLGGDEFLMMLGTEPDVDQVTNLAKCVADALAAPVRIGREWTAPKASVGVAYATAEDGLDADALVSAADTAMYDGKRAGDGTPVVTHAQRR
jgi:diguanylate cyclase (GGDEF)-like protein/PAS domain S-box-containing protein